MSSAMQPGPKSPGGVGAPGRLRPRNFHSQVIWALGTAIVEGEYPEGAILPGDADLIEQFGVSRTVLREALKTLSAKGLIEARARVGTRVLPRDRWNMFDSDILAWHLESGLSMTFVNHLADVRMAVEPEAAALAAERRTAAQAEDLMYWLGQMAEPGQAPEHFALNDLQFHKAVAAASGNPFMVSLSAVVEVALTASFTVSSPVNDSKAFERAVNLHRDIALSIQSGDPDGARAAMRLAIRSGVDRAESALTGEPS